MAPLFLLCNWKVIQPIAVGYLAYVQARACGRRSLYFKYRNVTLRGVQWISFLKLYVACNYNFYLLFFSLSRSLDLRHEPCFRFVERSVPSVGSGLRRGVVTNVAAERRQPPVMSHDITPRKTTACIFTAMRISDHVCSIR